MKTFTKAALIAAAVLTASSAQAVSYIRYDVATTGSGTFIGYDGINPETGGFYFKPFTTFNFSYVIALNSPRTSLNLNNSSSAIAHRKRPTSIRRVAVQRCR